MVSCVYQDGSVTTYADGATCPAFNPTTASPLDTQASIPNPVAAGSLSAGLPYIIAGAVLLWIFAKKR